jgi:hypothetical protein
MANKALIIEDLNVPVKVVTESGETKELKKEDKADDKSADNR